MAEAAIHSALEPGQRERREARRRVTSVQLMLALALAIGLILALNFSGRINLDRALGRIHRQFSAEIDELLAQQHALIAELNYVKSDAYVEYWARDEGKMVKDGEVLIQPQRPGADAVQPQSAVQLVAFVTTAPEPENWELWWALFFDGPPPTFG